VFTPVRHLTNYGDCAIRNMTPFSLVEASVSEESGASVFRLEEKSFNSKVGGMKRL
jgi:hypothetical protein